MKKLFWLAPILVAAFALVAQPAGATLMLTLGTGNMAIAGYTGPYADVAVTRTDATHATVVFTSRVVGGNIYLFGDGGVVGLNLNGGISSWSATVANGGTGFTTNASNLSYIGSGTEDGFGDFNFRLKNFDGFSYSYDTISLTLTKSSGSWANDADVLTPNGDGYSAAAHIFVTSSPANASNGALITGYAADGTNPPPVPEPTSMLLLGLGLAGSGGLGFARRRRRK